MIKSVFIEDQMISYIKMGSGNKTILFIHGNSLSSKSFCNQLDSDLINQYQLIAVDLPGCGNSEFLSNKSNYSIRYFSYLISQLIEALQIKNVILCGHSLGGHIALEVLEKNDEIKAVFIFGTPPLTVPLQLEKAFLPHPASQYLFAESFSGDALATIMNGFFSNGYLVPDFVIEDLKNSDGKLRSGLLASAGRGEFEDESLIIKNTDKKVAVLHSVNDKMINAEYFSLLDRSNIWKHEVQFLEKGGHFPQMENAVEFNNYLKDFCSIV